MLCFLDGAELVVEAGPVVELLLVVQNVVLCVAQQPFGGCWLGCERGEHSGSEGGRSVHASSSTHGEASRQWCRVTARQEGMRRLSTLCVDRTGSVREARTQIDGNA